MYSARSGTLNTQQSMPMLCERRAYLNDSAPTAACQRGVDAYVNVVEVVSWRAPPPLMCGHRIHKPMSHVGQARSPRPDPKGLLSRQVTPLYGQPLPARPSRWSDERSNDRAYDVPCSREPDIVSLHAKSRCLQCNRLRSGCMRRGSGTTRSVLPTMILIRTFCVI